MSNLYERKVEESDELKTKIKFIRNYGNLDIDHDKKEVKFEGHVFTWKYQSIIRDYNTETDIVENIFKYICKRVGLKIIKK